MAGISIDVTERRRIEEEMRGLSGRLISAQEDERARIASALHDDVTQRLALLAIETGRNESSFAESASKQFLRSMRKHLEQLSEDVHALCYALHPVILQDLGLSEALRAECERFNSAEALLVDFKAGDFLDDPPRPVALCLYRVAQEALRNIARHSHASSTEVSLRSADGGVQLTVRDNGIGFDPKQKRDRPSLGQASMRERLSLIGGTLHIESAPGRGTTVLAWAPLTKEAYDEASAGAAG
jgi:signal transduction histidine kinase